jgi:hypothetical protein
MAVNISAIQFRNDDSLNETFTTLRETGLDPTSLELELTESVLMNHADAVASVLQMLRDRGVQQAVDDFGTGYSSLSYLKKFLSMYSKSTGRSSSRSEPDEHRDGNHRYGSKPGIKGRGGRCGDRRGAGISSIPPLQRGTRILFSRPVVSLDFAKLLMKGFSKDLLNIGHQPR